MAFKIKQSDTSPILEAALTTAAGVAIDLSGASVRFHMRRAGAQTALIDAAATVVSASGGTVRYSWLSGDTDSAGAFVAEFEVLYSDGSIETFPNDGYLRIDILPEIA